MEGGGRRERPVARARRDEFWVADCGEAPDNARAIAAEHNAMPQLLAGDHLACMRQRNALDEASPVMMTVLAMLADEASIEELRAIALLLPGASTPTTSRSGSMQRSGAASVRGCLRCAMG